MPFLQQLIGSWEARTRQIFEEGSKKRQIFKSLTNINEKSHPEIYAFMTTLRNQIWAQKLDYLASKIPHQSNRKPEIGILVGRGHSGLENAIGENPKQRLDFLKRFLKLNPINISDIQLSKILHFEYNPYPDEATVRKRIKYPTYVTESDGSVHTQGIWELKEIIDEPLLKEEVQ